jgi:hypothetical protein
MTNKQDPDRMFRTTRIGNVQAWSALAGNASIAMSYFAGIKHAASGASYVSHTLNLTVEDARDIARALVEAADHADSLPRVASAEDRGIAA